MFHSISMQCERDDGFLLDFSWTKSNLIWNRKENWDHDYVSFNLKGNGNIVFSATPLCLQLSERLTSLGIMKTLVTILLRCSRGFRGPWCWEAISDANSFKGSVDISSILTPCIKSICKNIKTWNHCDIFYHKRHVHFGHCHPCLPGTQRNPFLCLVDLNWI